MEMINAISNLNKQNMEQINSLNHESTSKVAFSSYLNKSQTMDDIFEKAAKKYNVDVDLLKAIGKAESNFNANAVSRCGAQGVMQLMPSTAASLGVTDSLDPEQNIMGGAKYISSLLKKYDGDRNLALAAYNAGSGNVAKYGGIPPFKETQSYVVKVNSYMNETLTANASVSTQKGIKDVPVVNVSTSTSETSKISDFDDIFSYADYLRFMDILMAWKL